MPGAAKTQNRIIHWHYIKNDTIAQPAAHGRAVTGILLEMTLLQLSDELVIISARGHINDSIDIPGSADRRCGRVGD